MKSAAASQRVCAICLLFKNVCPPLDCLRREYLPLHMIGTSSFNRITSLYNQRDSFLIIGADLSLCNEWMSCFEKSCFALSLFSLHVKCDQNHRHTNHFYFHFNIILNFVTFWFLFVHLWLLHWHNKENQQQKTFIMARSPSRNREIVIMLFELCCITNIYSTLRRKSMNKYLVMKHWRPETKAMNGGIKYKMPSLTQLSMYICLNPPSRMRSKNKKAANRPADRLSRYSNFVARCSYVE